MDVELTRDEEDIILYLDRVEYAADLPEIKTRCSQVDNPEDILSDLEDVGIVYSYLMPYWRNKVIYKMKLYILTGKGKEAVEWM